MHPHEALQDRLSKTVAPLAREPTLNRPRMLACRGRAWHGVKSLHEITKSWPFTEVRLCPAMEGLLLRHVREGKLRVQHPVSLRQAFLEGTDLEKELVELSVLSEEDFEVLLCLGFLRLVLRWLVPDPRLSMY